MKYAVVHGAELMCSCGSKPDQLRVVSENTVAICNNLAATVADNEPGVNVGPFGTCAVGGQPCTPAFPGQWIPGCASVVRIGGHRALRDTDMLPCARGGMVKITFPMQANTHVDQ